MFKRSLLVALAVAPLTLTSALAGDVIYKDAFARETPPSAKVGGAFMTLHNHGKPNRLVGARSDVAGLVQIHTHTIDDAGIMRMRRLEDGLALDTHETVTLEPGGHHIMLMNLKEPLRKGESVDITLEFEHGDTLDVTVPILSIAAQGTGGHGDHGDHAKKKKHEH